MMNLCIATMAKDETPYLVEWCEYHLMLGVDHVVIADNKSKMPIADTLKRQCDAGQVTVVLCDAEPMTCKAQTAMLNDMRIRFGPETRWMAHIDIDEFLLPKQDDSLPAMLSRYEAFGGLVIPWQCFGSSGYEHHAHIPVTERFTHRTEGFLPVFQNENMDPGSVKTIYQPSRVAHVDSAHVCTYADKWYAVTEDGQPYKRERGRKNEIVGLNHYVLRSREEWQERCMRRKFVDNPRSYHQFDLIDRWANRIEDRTLLNRFGARLKARLEALS